MSVVVAVKEKNQIVMACDSLASGDSGPNFRAGSKIFHKGPCMIGFVGDYRLARIFEFDVAAPKRRTGPKLRIVHDLANAYRTIVLERTHIDTDNGAEIYNNFLVALGGQLFMIDGNFGALEIDEDFYAIGAGSQYAIGALDNGANIEAAVVTAVKFCPSVGLPLVVERSRN